MTDASFPETHRQTREALDSALNDVPCDTYAEHRTLDGWRECRYCGQSEKTHRVIKAAQAALAEIDRLRTTQAEYVKIYQKLSNQHADLLRELDQARRLLNPNCAEETLCGAIRNLQQAHLSEKGNAEAAEAEIDRLRQALKESVKLQSHYADLLNMHDGGQRIRFADADAWIRRLEGQRP